MNRLRRLSPLCLLLFATGCGQSTASLAREMKSSDPLARLNALHTLEGRKAEAAVVIPALTAALKDEDSYVRRDAARALGQFGSAAKDAIPALADLLHDKEPSVRKAAAQSLPKIELRP